MNLLISPALLKEQLKRFWVIAALPTLGYLLFVVAPIVNLNWNNPYYALTGVIRLLSMSNAIVILASVGVPFITAMSLFSYMFNPRAAVAFGAYPLNRKQIFFTNVAAGLLLMVIPLIILCASLLAFTNFTLVEHPDAIALTIPTALFPGGLNIGDHVNLIPVMAGFFARLAVIHLFYFALFSITAALSGHGVVAALLSAATPFIPLGIMGIDQAAKYWMVVGHDMTHLEQTLKTVLLYTNPVCWFWAFEDYYATTSVISASGVGQSWSSFSDGNVLTHLPLMPLYILLIVALLAVAYFLNRRRKMERTGDSVVFNPFKQVLIFLVSLAGGSIMFVFFLNIFNEQKIIYGSYLGFALGFTVAFFVAQMIAEKTFNVGHKFKSLIKFGAVMAVAYLVVFASSRLDLNHYQRYVPSASDVSGVYIGDLTGATVFHAGRQKDWVTDREIIEETVAAHRRTVSDLGAMRKIIDYRLMGWKMPSGEQINRQNVSYKLNNGKTVTRTYYVTEAMMQDLGWVDLRTDARVAISDYAFLQRPDNVKNVRLTYISGFDYETGEYSENAEIIEANIMDAAEIASLFEAVKKDLPASEKTFLLAHISDVFSEHKLGWDSISVSVEPKGTGIDPQTYTYSVFYNVNLNEYENTKAWMEERGYWNGKPLELVD